MLGDVMSPGDVAVLTVTTTAGCGDVHHIAGGSGIPGVVYLMLPMAIDARGGIGVAAGECPAVQAVAVQFRDIIVALTAVHFCQGRVVGKFLDICIDMARNTAIILMNRSLENALFDKQ